MAEDAIAAGQGRVQAVGLLGHGRSRKRENAGCGIANSTTYERLRPARDDDFSERYLTNPILGRGGSRRGDGFMSSLMASKTNTRMIATVTSIVRRLWSTLESQRNPNLDSVSRPI